MIDSIDLGLVKAIHKGLTAPTNTAMLWYDDNVGVKVHKYYDTVTSTWEELLRSTDIIDITYANLSILLGSSTLLKGVYYNITDKADAGIIVQATSTNTLSLQAKGLFLNCDYQDAGDYSGLALPKGDNYKVWTLALQAGNPYVNNDIVFWNGIMYQVIDDTLFDTSNPSINTNAYLPLSKSITNGYILESDDIIYDFNNDVFIERTDKRGNVIRGYDAIEFFQWGNDFVTDVKGYLECWNNKGTLRSLTFIQKANLSSINEKNLGEVRDCSFEVGNINLVIELGINGIMSNSIVKTTVDLPSDNIIISKDVAFQGEMDSFKSSFTADLDMADPFVFSLGTLTIPIELNYIGEFTLIGNTGQTITKIVNLSTLHKVTRFSVQPGKTQNFNHTSVSVNTADLLNAPSVGTITLTGRVDSNDFVDYEKMGNRNVLIGNKILA